MITISICMIVKDEEAVLKRCLDNFSKAADEIIIVDTGSTDGTWSIASQYTDKIYPYIWKGDFADARNFSFSKATMDYILCIDADEVLDNENLEKLLCLKKVLLPEIDIVQMYYTNQLEYNTVYNYDKEYRPKLYKRVRHFIFEDPIHEVVRMEPVVYDSEIEILHKPQGLHAQRDFGGFLRLFDKEGKLPKRLHNMYAKELFIAGTEGDFLNAIPVFEHTLIDCHAGLDTLQEAFLVLAHAYRMQKDVVLFFKYAMKLVCMEGCSEICCELGDFYAEQDDLEEAQLWYYNAIHETSCMLSIEYQNNYPQSQLDKINSPVTNS